MNARLTLPAHGSIELAAGMVTVAAPVMLGFSPLGIVLAAVLGATLMGVGMTLQGDTSRSWHAGVDAVFVVMAALGALALALAGQTSATLYFAVLVVALALLGLVTRE